MVLSENYNVHKTVDHICVDYLSASLLQVLVIFFPKLFANMYFDSMAALLLQVEMVIF